MHANFDYCDAECIVQTLKAAQVHKAPHTAKAAKADLASWMDHGSLPELAVLRKVLSSLGKLWLYSLQQWSTGFGSALPSIYLTGR